MSNVQSSYQNDSFTFSALVDILSDSFAICRTAKYHSCGSYYYSEIKCAKWEKRCINVLQSSLYVLDGKIDSFTIHDKKKLITRALIDFVHRNIPSSDADMLLYNMRWVIVKF